MQSSDRPAASTEITVITGDRYRITRDPRDVERIIIDAARGSIMQMAWLIDAETGAEIAVNPDHVVTLKAADS
jgi:hypothetical protein